MDLKFTFGASNPLPLSAEGAGSPSAHSSSASSSAESSRLELRVSLGDGAVVCEGLSGDGVSYARAERTVEDPASPALLAAAVRSTLARGGAALPEPLLDAVGGVVLDLGGREREALAELGLPVSESVEPSSGASGTGTAVVSAVDAALQARTGVAAGTPIRVAGRAG